MSKPHWGELIFFWILFTITGILAFAIMKPYFVALFLAIVFGVLFAPVYRYFLKSLGGKTGLSALLTVLVVLFLVFVPLTLLGILMFQEVTNVYSMFLLGEENFSYFTQVATVLERHVQSIIPSFHMQTDIGVYFGEALRFIGVNLSSFVSGTLAVLFEAILIIVAMFFLYRDGKSLREFIVRWSPLADRYDESILAKLEMAIESVVRGSLVVAVLQGLVTGLGFLIFGLPNPVLWGVVTTIAALVPLLGTALVVIPWAVVLFFQGSSLSALGFLLWGVVVVGTVDNIARPLLMRRAMKIHPFLIFLSVLGGLAYFGPVGFLAGPIVFVLFFTLLEIYPEIMKGRAIKQDEPSVD